jgi:hypothetical protein
MASPFRSYLHCFGKNYPSSERFLGIILFATVIKILSLKKQSRFNVAMEGLEVLFDFSFHFYQIRRSRSLCLSVRSRTLLSPISTAAYR